jgi:hypothetical protein
VCRRCGEIDPSGPKQYDSSPYTAERVREEAQRAADDPHIEYSMTSEDGTRLEIPKDEEFLDFPRMMATRADASNKFSFLPVPAQGHEALGKAEHGELVLIVATRVSEEEKDENSEPVIYYFTVAPDGRAGWNTRTAFSVTGDWIGCKTGHDWHDSSCVLPESCSKCGATRGDLGEHDYSKATCQKPETCKYCGATEGGPDPNAHVWQYVGCEEQEVCALCGAKGPVSPHQFVRTKCGEPQKCSVCGAEGPVAEHEYEETVIKQAKCKETGKKSLRCKHCGDNYEEEIPALGHDWVRGETDYGRVFWKCSRCPEVRWGDEEPDPFSRVSIIVREQ